MSVASFMNSVDFEAEAVERISSVVKAIQPGAVELAPLSTSVGVLHSRSMSTYSVGATQSAEPSLNARLVAEVAFGCRVAWRGPDDTPHQKVMTFLTRQREIREKINVPADLKRAVALRVTIPYPLFWYEVMLQACSQQALPTVISGFNSQQVPMPVLPDLAPPDSKFETDLVMVVERDSAGSCTGIAESIVSGIRRSGLLAHCDHDDLTLFAGDTPDPAGVSPALPAQRAEDGEVLVCVENDVRQLCNLKPRRSSGAAVTAVSAIHSSRGAGAGASLLAPSSPPASSPRSTSSAPRTPKQVPMLHLRYAQSPCTLALSGKTEAEIGSAYVLAEATIDTSVVAEKLAQLEWDALFYTALVKCALSKGASRVIEVTAGDVRRYIAAVVLVTTDMEGVGVLIQTVLERCVSSSALPILRLLARERRLISMGMPALQLASP